jgi:hypothetical protein
MNYREHWSTCKKGKELMFHLEYSFETTEQVAPGPSFHHEEQINPDM